MDAVTLKFFASVAADIVLYSDVEVRLVGEVLAERDAECKKGKNRGPQPEPVPVNIDLYSAEHSRKLHFTSQLRLPLTRKFLEDLEGQGIAFNIVTEQV